jgi:hypothetical protein
MGRAKGDPRRGGRMRDLIAEVGGKVRLVVVAPDVGVRRSPHPYLPVTRSTCRWPGARAPNPDRGQGWHRSAPVGGIGEAARTGARHVTAPTPASPPRAPSLQS